MIYILFILLYHGACCERESMSLISLKICWCCTLRKEVSLQKFLSKIVLFTISLHYIS